MPLWILFWAPLLLLAWVYVLYPLVALAMSRLRPVRLVAGDRRPKLVTVGIAVHDGAPEIEDRLADVFAQSPPFELEVIVASDGSTDGTVAAVERYAAADPRVRLIDLPRVGQSAAQSRIFAAASGEVVVLTDVQTRYAERCLEELVAPFADDRVGCTTGILRWQYDRRTQTAYHEGLYWRFEQRVRAWESRAGWLAAGTGALLASRRSLFRPVEAHASLDQMLPLIAREANLLVLARPLAVGIDRGTMSLVDQFRSRTRIATQGIEANLRMAMRITPWRRPGTALTIWSHKLLRWATPWLAAIAAAAGGALFAGGEPAWFLVPAAAAVVLGLAATVGYIGWRVGKPLPIVGFALTIAAINLAFTVAWVNVLLRRRVGTWEVAAETADR
ncbi:MAG: glycosyltransferase [Chloroflexota bacterium]